MADYGVPEDLEGTLPWSWAEDKLAASKNFWLATVNAGGRPHSMPVWGVWIPERERFALSCSPNARKVRNIAANNQVVVTTDDAASFVSIEGTAEPLTGDDVETMARAYAHKYSDEPMIEEEGMVDFLLQNASYEVTPLRAFGMIETPEDFGPAATKWTWD